METYISKKYGYITCEWYKKERLFFISTSEHRIKRNDKYEQWWLNTEEEKSILELLKLQK
jgi:hypothetical protein